MRRLHFAALAVALVVVGWIRWLPLSLDGVTRGAESAVRAAIARETGAASEVGAWIDEYPIEYQRRLEAERAKRRGELSFEAADGRLYPYLGGFDSYVWLRAARNVLENGSACDSIVEGQCRDEYTLAPVGVRSRYATSVHVAALASFHRLLTYFDPGIPLSASGFYLSLFVSLVGLLPAYWLGARFGGVLGGLVCSVLVGVNGVVLFRTFGADNDVWNVVLPLFEVWAIVEAFYARAVVLRALLVVFAAAVTAVHAATWAGWIFTAGVVTIGLGANLLLRTIRLLLYRSSAEARSGAAQALLLLVLYLISTSAGTAIAGAETTPVAAARTMMLDALAGARRVQERARDEIGRPVGDVESPLEAEAPDEGASAASDEPTEVGTDRQKKRKPRRAAGGVAAETPLKWPSVFETVGELRDPSLGGIAHATAGPLFFFIAWLGMILLMLPRQGWESWHFILLIGGNLLYRYLLTLGGLDPYFLAVVLVIPLAMGIGAYLADRSRSMEDQGAGLMIIIWFLGGLIIAHRGNRFLLLLAPPMAILCGVAFGRLYEWFARQTWAKPPALRVAAFVALAATVWIPLQQGRATASSYLPTVDDAWADSLERLRTETPPDTIVNSWWDYGYFIKYLADRRVLSDGGTLGTHVHHWVALALMSDDPEQSLGILRMLNCGSAAYPEPEGALGAYGRLRAAGLGSGPAYATVLAMTSETRPEAARRLRELDLTEAEVEAVLLASHCDPAPAYLILPSAMIYSVGWREIGKQSLVDATAASLLRRRGGQRAAANLARRFGLSKPEARAIVRRAREHDGYRHTPGYAPGSWIACDDDWQCAVNQRIPSGDVVRRIAIDPDRPGDSRVVIAGEDGDESLVPTALLVAGANGLERFEPSDDSSFRLALLIDHERRRVLLGIEQILRSTFTRLMFLEARHLEHFTETHRRTGIFGEVVTWKIQW